MSDGPQLGLASTEQMVRELISRFTVPYLHDAVGMRRNTDRALTLAEMLGGMTSFEREYRTVDA